MAIGFIRNKIKALSLFLILAASLTLTACLYDSEKLAEQNRREHEEKCERVMSEMESRLSAKYADILGNDPDEIVFDVYDISKGGHKAWFQSGFYPAKAKYKDIDEEFTVQIEVQIDRIGEMEDSFYGVLYGAEVKQELRDLVESYGAEVTNIYYLPCKDILTEEKDLREHLIVFGNYRMKSDDDIEVAAELADKLLEFGCENRVSADGRDIGKGATGFKNEGSDYIREFFK